ncbi:hypothetical protein SH601_15650 [Gracilibacillus sp. S3-1-1]|uniref:Uncharacterized protein n=1 Tax=Gracilibacillus pellucidus TaxID=3095368 RepID=A0ACC6M8V6_9BACI|nr:hypothetical protein [Gracilibacillus sp. S3-1-1]MDX8047404.1 hypothetical protein [Gracilibacillus sp. S3-1-1]
MYKEAIMTTLIILSSLVVLNKFKKRLHRANHHIIFEVKLSKEHNASTFIDRVQYPIEIREFDISNENPETTKIRMILMQSIKRSVIIYLRGCWNRKKLGK